MKMDSTKRYFIISAVVFILVIIIIVALVSFLAKPKYVSYYTEKFNNCISENQQTHNLLMAAKTEDANYCVKLPVEQAKACIAAIKKDVTICGDRPEPKKIVCQAEILKNPALCPPEDAWCLAYASRDEKYCAQLTEESSKKECITYVRMDAESFISEKAKQECSDSAYAYAAIVSRDKTACDKIKDLKLKENCLNSLKQT
ncbi:MAG: hypothetical protein QW666_00540 [Candidatus Woesearchaeota archaeon]